MNELQVYQFQLDGLEHLPSTLRKKVVNMITTPPVSHFLKIFAYYPQPDQSPIPISYIERAAALPLAA
jgi:hypothetical protein